MDLEHLSYSSISSYLACGYNWKLHYLDKIATPGSPALVFGSAWHGTLERFLQSGYQADLVGAWREEWAKEVGANPEVDWGAGPEELCNDGVRMLSSAEIRAGLLSIRPAIDKDGARIERKVELRVPGVPLPIIGYIDIVTDDGVPGDFKTSARAWSADKATGETQPLFYLAALNQAGETVPGWRFRHFVFVKTKTPQFQVIEHHHNPGQLLWLFSMIRSVWEGIEAGVFPMNPGSWKCSPSFCDYYARCRGRWG